MAGFFARPFPVCCYLSSSPLPQAHCCLSPSSVSRTHDKELKSTDSTDDTDCAPVPDPCFEEAVMQIPEPGSHLDHMLRQTRMHHVQLSTMADVKANMMLTLASLVITFSIRYIADPLLRWPVITLALFCLATVLAAAYAVMPKLDFKRRPNPANLDCDLLFFGNFMNLNYQEYVEAMESIMSSPARAYEAQVREVYNLGVFLGRKKYRYVRLAYLFFIVGLVVSGAVFLVVELL